MSRPAADPTQPPPAVDGRAGLARDVSLWLGAVILGGGAVFWLLDGLRVRDWWPFRHPLAGSDMYDLTRSTVALTGLLGATVAVALAIRRQRATEQTVRITAEAQRTAAQAQRTAADAQLVTANAYELDLKRNDQEQVRDLRDRFTTAAGQLGHDAPAVRLAGIYAMAGLADDWLQREQPDEAQACIDVLCAYLRTPRRSPTTEDTRADLEVRQTIIRTITKRLQPGDRLVRDWRGHDFDFAGATFNGSYTFRGAQFDGGTVSFVRAEFTGGEVSFDRAEFADGDVSFDGAAFAGGDVSFRGAQFAGGIVSFGAAEFTHGIVSFGGAKFTRGTVFFYGAKFTRGTVSFNHAEFTGDVSFNGAEFTGGTVSFIAAKFADAAVPGPWGEQPPKLWPPPQAARES